VPAVPDPVVPVPDTKDWTHVVTGGCSACGYLPPRIPAGPGSA
jgi:hypothetical protein